MNRLKTYLGDLWKRLMELQGTPHAIAGGVAIGIFWGFTPLFGLKTLLCLATAAVLGLNPLAAVLAVTFHDIVTPLWPVILRVEYEIGYWILSNPHQLPPKMEMHHLKLHELFSWKVFSTVGLPLMVGAVVVAIPFAAASYAAFFAMMTRRERRKLAKAGESGVKPSPLSQNDH